MTRGARGPRIALFVAAAVVYVCVGVWLSVDNQFFVGDSLSRVAATQSALFSRDPHLAAIGFVFTPLTALAELPLIALSQWLPFLARDAMAANAMSALFMAGAVVQIYALCRDRGVRSAVTWTLTVAFAINPMIVFYAANGMSEAPFVFFICVILRRLIRWLDTDDVHDLGAAAAAAGLAYLTRYDAVAATLGAALMVATVTYSRTRGDPRARRQRAILDVAVLTAPSALAFVGWAAASWLTSGQAFAQFTSEYGNAAIVAASGGGENSKAAGLVFAITEIALLAPALPILIAAAVARKRGWALICPLIVGGGVLAMQALTYATGSTFGFLRFYIVAIPMAAVLGAVVAGESGWARARRVGAAAPAPRPRTAARPVVAALCALLLIAGIPVTVWGMAQQRYAPQEFALRALVTSDDTLLSRRSDAARKVANSFSSERLLAEYLDSLDLPPGSVLADTTYGFAVVARSRRPDRYVLPSDTDFVTVLNDPAKHGVRYLLAVPPTGRGLFDALNRRYPTLYETGAGVGRLVLEVPNDGADLPVWRLFEVRV